MAIAVARRGYDDLNSGVQSQETILTADAVETHGIKIDHIVKFEGDARGCEAMTLVAPNIEIAGKRRDLAIAATLGNDVVAHDAYTGELLWKRNLGPPVKSTAAIDNWEINDHIGILSTPTLDSATAPSMVYCCYWSSEDGSWQKAGHALAGVDLASGKFVRSPLSLQGAFYQPNGSRVVQRFNAGPRKQRGSLLFAKGPPYGDRGTVVIPFGSVFESKDTNQGWVIAVDVARWSIASALSMVAEGHGAGTWQAGAGLAMDASGYIYAMTANGAFDPEGGDFGESFVKIAYTAANGAMYGNLRVVDWWSPYLDDVRASGATAARLEGRGPGAATNRRAYLENVQTVPLNPPLDPGSARDMDLGSGGPALVPELGIVIGAGKDGIGYTPRMTSMGATTRQDLLTPEGVRANYQKLAAPPFWMTFFPGWDVASAPADIKDLNVLYRGRTHHQHGSPVVWSSPLGVWAFCWGENGPLRVFRLQGEPHDASRLVRVSQHFLAAGNEYASAAAPKGGMPGGMMSLSWDGKDPRTAVLWATIPYGDANTEITKGRLLAYRLDQLGAGRIPLIWDSQRWNWDFDFVKFTPPTVANGVLYLLSYDGRRIACKLA